MIEKDTVLTDDKQIAKTMNSFLISTTKKLDLKHYKISTLMYVDRIISNSDSHNSIKKVHVLFPNFGFTC